MYQVQWYLSPDDAGEIMERNLKDAIIHVAEKLKIGATVTCKRLMEDKAPYGEWCRGNGECSALGYCPRDPTCGD